MTIKNPWNLLIKHLKQVYVLLLTTVRKHVYINLLVGVFFLALVGSAIAIASKDDYRDTPKATASTLGADTNSTSKKTASTELAQPATNPSTNQQPATASPKPKTQAPAPAPANTQKTLKISPSSFTMNPGESFPITIQASDGRAINMPMFSAGAGKALLNFGGSPAKPVWSGNIVANKVIAPGTYTLEIAGQASRTEWYRGTITITIVQPTMQIAIQSLGYDADDDSLGYTVKVNRFYGFTEPVVDVIDSATEPGLGCDSYMPDSYTINLTCFHYAGDRPTNGTLSITVKTNTVTRSGTVSYSLPPL